MTVQKYDIPILLIAFNRPATTRIVLEAIKKVKPSRLYLALEAPRENNSEDELAVKEVRELFDSIDWAPNVYKRYAETNQGCGNGVYNAISWVFEYEEKAVILEDDCVPTLNFFYYCEELLILYKNDPRVWMISGNNYNEELVTTRHSYFFSKYMHIWGWATWKRSWDQMDLSIKKYGDLLEQNLFYNLYHTKAEALYFKKRLDYIYYKNDPKPYTWDFQFGLTILMNNGLCIMPVKNIVTNIGYSGIHTKSKNKYHERKVDEKFKITSHPDFVICDVNYDTNHFKKHWNVKKPIYMRFLHKALRLLGISK